jgi:beta-xylosidase
MIRFDVAVSKPWLSPRGGVLMITALLAAWLPGVWRAGAQAFDPTRQYRNPVLFADYSDPDVIRDGAHFYLIASSFEFVPGLPVLESEDLVNWRIVTNIVRRLTMSPAYDMTGEMRYGRGVWAPAVRFHHGLFYVYFPTPDEGIFVTTAPHMSGPWSQPATVLAGPGWEDPCPFWDDDGNAYLVHSKLHAGPLILHRMSADGLHLLDQGRVIVSDPVHLPTLEGPKLYKRNGWYYIFAPMGGVAVGAQVVLRSRSLYGPYEARQTLTQGTTDVNGPHQGAWVDSPDGRAWFIHFQQRGAHGRIVWLEPMHWQPDGWPVMGVVPPGAVVGQPVFLGPLPVVDTGDKARPQTSDEFTAPTLSAMWEWNHNPDDTRWSLTERPGFLRLHPSQGADLLHARNSLTECMQNESLQITTRLYVDGLKEGDRAGLSIFDRGASQIGVVQQNGNRSLYISINGIDIRGPQLPAGKRTLQLRARVLVDTATYSYSLDDGKSFQPLGQPVHLVFSWWKGARPMLFAYNTQTESKGHADFDWLHYVPISSTEQLSTPESRGPR